MTDRLIAYLRRRYGLSEPLARLLAELAYPARGGDPWRR